MLKSFFSQWPGLSNESQLEIVASTKVLSRNCLGYWTKKMPKMKLVKSLPWLTKTGNKIATHLIFWFLQRRCYKQRRHRYYFVVSWAASHWSAGDPDFFCNFSARVRSLSGLVTLTHWFTNLSNELKSWLIRPWLMKIPSCIVVDVLESADYSLETAVICIFTYWQYLGIVWSQLEIGLIIFV